MSPQRRVRDLALALAIHVCAIPVWLVQAFVWNGSPPGIPRTARERAMENAIIGTLAFTIVALYVALLVALIVWWRQGRRRLFLSPLTAAGLALLPCLLPLLFVRGVRRALVPGPPPPPAVS